MQLRRSLKQWIPPALTALLPRAPAESVDIDVGGAKVVLDIRDPSTRHLHHEYFALDRFRFESISSKPLIIDCGAHIGVSVLYWKSLFPQANVIAFEPDKVNFSALQRTCSGLRDVELHNAAVWSSNAGVAFAAVGSEGGHIADLSDRDDGAPVEKVPTVRLRELLNRPVELLKLDIEGAEIDVLSDCANHLTHVRRIFVEYHSFVDRPQRLGHFFSLIENAGFRIHAHSELPAYQPFVNRPVFNRKDFRLNVFAVR